MFCDRPLTWLFVVATICVDLIAIGPQNLSSSFGLFQWGIYLGQAAVLGCWLSVGARHRLERGALFVVGQLVLTTVYCLRLPSGTLGLWGQVIPPFAFFGVMAAVGVFVGKVCFSRFQMSSRVERSNVLRYSLMELIGWTVVVAIAAASLRHAELLSIVKIPRFLLFFLGFSMNIGVFTELLFSRDRYRHALLFSLAFSSALYYFFFLKVLGISYPPYVLAFVVSMAYVMLWIVVSRLDATSLARRALQTSSDDQTSPLPPQRPRAAVPQDLQS